VFVTSVKTSVQCGESLYLKLILVTRGNYRVDIG
jgi:hypothetical protein